jgi:hypothetical protein
MSGALSRDASLQFERSMQSAPPHGLQEYNPMMQVPFWQNEAKKVNDFRARRPCRDFAYCLNERTQWAALLTAASQRLVSLKFALELPAVGDPALIVIGLPGPVFITQGPSAHVKHP